MGSRVRAFLGTIAATMIAGACTLTTDLGGYAGPAVDPLHDAGDAVANDATTQPDAPDAMPVSASEAYRALVLSDAPVAYWRLDEPVVAKDQVGGHDGMYMGNVQPADGILGGRAAAFDSTGFIAIGDAFGFTGNAPFTIEVWTAPTKAGSGPACMVAKDAPNDAGSIEEGWAFYLGTANEIYASRWQSGTQEYAKGPIVPTGAFSHLVMTYDGQSIVAFRNGVLEGDLTSKVAVGAITSRLTIGASRDGTGCFFHGVLDEVAIYDKALPNDRVLAHYEAGKL